MSELLAAARALIAARRLVRSAYAENREREIINACLDRFRLPTRISV